MTMFDHLVIVVDNLAGLKWLRRRRRRTTGGFRVHLNLLWVTGRIPSAI